MISARLRDPFVLAWPLALLLLVGVSLAFHGWHEEQPDAVPVAAQPAKYVIVIAADALRADHLGCYGYPRGTSPKLDRLASISAVFEQAMSPAPAPLPSHVTLLTGVDPRVHFVRHPGHLLPQSFVTLAETLGQVGFKTAAFMDNAVLGRDAGIDQGFDLFEEDYLPGDARVNGFRRYGDKVKRWLNANRGSRCFLYLHDFDVHGPYYAEEKDRTALRGPPVVPEGAASFDDPTVYLKSLAIHDYLRVDERGLPGLIDDYDCAIHALDERIGGLLEFLLKEGMLDDAMVIVTAPHGESFLDHGLYVGHGLALNQEELRVPLLVRFPHGRFAGARAREVVRLMDVAPTICAACGVSPPEQAQGRDLAPLLAGDDREPRLALAESVNLAAPGVDGVPGMTWAWRLRDMKLISKPALPLERVYRDHLNRVRDGAAPDDAYSFERDPLGLKARLPQQAQLFDLGKDPLEQDDLAPARPDEVAAIVAKMEAEEQKSLETRLLFEGNSTKDVAAQLHELDVQVENGFMTPNERDRRRKIILRGK